VSDVVLKSGTDSLSSLIQLHAGQHGLRLAWTGHGISDLALLCNNYANSALAEKHFRTSMYELARMPEVATLPEAMQARIVSIVLQAQAFTDIEAAQQAKRLELANKMKGA